jgi:Arc/MetJ family transcription regulator
MVTERYTKGWDSRAGFNVVELQSDLTTDTNVLKTMPMKRTSLVLDEHVLDEARRLAGGITSSAVVNLALQDLVRRIRARRILDLAGSGLWGGRLSAMREVRPRIRRSRRS